MLLKKILENIEYKVIKGNLNIEINDICYNSKNVKNNDGFIALIGHNMDGHNYISDAIEKGATVIFVEKDIDLKDDVTIIKLKNLRIIICKFI